MPQQHPSVFFNEAHAASYDERFARLAPLRDALDLLMKVILSDQPAKARILCVGAGTGSEILHLASSFPHWRFKAVEPSAPMLEVCRRRLSEHGLADRCDFHHGFLDSLPPSEPYDAATSLLVSHFILTPEARGDYFRSIAAHLKPGGSLVNADLACDTTSPTYARLLNVWLRMMKGAEVPDAEIEKMHQAYGRDVALWPPGQVSGTIASNGFETPVMFFQAGLIHAWLATRSSSEPPARQLSTSH